MKKQYIPLGLLLLALCFTQYVVAVVNPYKVLGVSKRAKDSEIDKAYRKLAKQWHPDKNPSEEAAEKFLELTEAYDILKDRNKRSEYDRYGSHSNGRRGPPSYNNYRHSRYNYAEYLSRRDRAKGVRITKENYEYVIQTQMGEDAPFDAWVIFVYGDFCGICSKVAPHFEDMVSKTRGLLNTGYINSDFETSLTRQLRVKTIPTILGVTVLNGKTNIKYLRLHRKSQYTVNALLEWSGDLLRDDPNFGGIAILTKDHTTNAVLALERRFQKFISRNQGAQWSGFKDEKVKVVFISQRPSPHIVVKALARKLSHMEFGHVCMSCVQKHNRARVYRILGLKVPESTSEVAQQIVIYREGKLAPVVISEGINNDLDALEDLLSPHSSLNIPLLHADNFYQLCLDQNRFKITSSSSLDRSSSSSSSSSPSSSSSSGTYCLILFAETRKEAWNIGLPLLKNESDNIGKSSRKKGSISNAMFRRFPPAISEDDGGNNDNNNNRHHHHNNNDNNNNPDNRSQTQQDGKKEEIVDGMEDVQIGWIRKAQQAEFQDYFRKHFQLFDKRLRKNRPNKHKQKIKAVLLDGPHNKYIPYFGEYDSDGIRSWLSAVNHRFIDKVKHREIKDHILATVQYDEKAEYDWISAHLANNREMKGFPFLNEEKEPPSLAASIRDALTWISDGNLFGVSSFSFVITIFLILFGGSFMSIIR